MDWSEILLEEEEIDHI